MVFENSSGYPSISLLTGSQAACLSPHPWAKGVDTFFLQLPRVSVPAILAPSLSHRTHLPPGWRSSSSFPGLTTTRSFAGCLPLPFLMERKGLDNLHSLSLVTRLSLLLWHLHLDFFVLVERDSFSPLCLRKPLAPISWIILFSYGKFFSLSTHPFPKTTASSSTSNLNYLSEIVTHLHIFKLHVITPVLCICVSYLCIVHIYTSSAGLDTLEAFD